MFHCSMLRPRQVPRMMEDSPVFATVSFSSRRDCPTVTKHETLVASDNHDAVLTTNIPANGM
jgi:hypothetical protein